MANVRNFDWGTSRSTLIPGTKLINERRVYCEGTYTIKPFSVVPLELHNNDAEFCTVQTPGMYAVVIDSSDSNFYNPAAVMEKLTKSKRLEVGDTIDCPKGFGLAMYNSLGLCGSVEFQKYYSST